MAAMPGQLVLVQLRYCAELPRNEALCHPHWESLLSAETPLALVSELAPQLSLVEGADLGDPGIDVVRHVGCLRPRDR